MSKKEEADSTRAIKAIGNNNHYLQVQIFDHRVLKAYELMSKPETLKTLKTQGYKHIALEIDEADQPLVDNYLKHKVSRNDLVKTLSVSNGHLSKKDGLKHGKTIADLIDNATDLGMQVHFINQHQPDKVIRELSEDLMKKNKSATVGDLKKELYSALDVNKQLSADPSQVLKLDFKRDNKYWQGALDRLSELNVKDKETLSELLPKVKTMAESRADGDKQIVTNLVGRTNGEPTVIVMGVGHGGYRDGTGGKKDLDEHLAPHGKVGKIGLAGDHKVPAHAKMAEMPNTMVYTNTGLFHKHMKIKIYDPSLPADAEINTNKTAGFNVNKYRDRPQSENDRVEQAKEEALAIAKNLAEKNVRQKGHDSSDHPPQTNLHNRIRLKESATPPPH